MPSERINKYSTRIYKMNENYHMKSVAGRCKPIDRARYLALLMNNHGVESIIKINRVYDVPLPYDTVHFFN